MNKKKLFAGLACLAVATVGCVALAGCGEQKDDWKAATDANFANLIQSKSAKIKLTEDVELEEREPSRPTKQLSLCATEKSRATPQHSRLMLQGARI